MCTVLLLLQAHPVFPLVVAANRDEFLVRPSLPPHRWRPTGTGDTPTILAGKDAEAGGTWMGINPHGLVAGVTNRYTGSRSPDKDSRGRLVLRSLLHRQPAAALHDLTADDLGRYNPFNLFCVRRDHGFVLTNHPQIWHPMLEPGATVLTNGRPGDPSDPKARWILNRFREAPASERALRERLVETLSHHGTPAAPDPVCVHLEGYGTVSSTLLLMARDPKASRYLHCEGPPCRNAYRDLSAELAVLLAS